MLGLLPARTLSLDAEFTPAYVNQAFSQLDLDRPQDAENTVQQAFAHKLQIPELLIMQYFLAYQKERCGCNGPSSDRRPR